MFGRILKELNLDKQIPLVTVVTDPCYGFWKGWACDDVSLYLVANDDARRQLVDYGISPEKIKISGMPVHPKFHEVDEADAQNARRAFGLDPDKFTVFVNAGWIGGGNIPQISGNWSAANWMCRRSSSPGRTKSFTRKPRK